MSDEPTNEMKEKRISRSTVSERERTWQEYISLGYASRSEYKAFLAGANLARSQTAALETQLAEYEMMMEFVVGFTFVDPEMYIERDWDHDSDFWMFEKPSVGKVRGFKSPMEAFQDMFKSQLTQLREERQAEEQTK